MFVIKWSGRNFSLKEMETIPTDVKEFVHNNTVRKELLSERDGNFQKFRVLKFSDDLVSGRNFSLKEMETRGAEIIECVQL